MEKQLALVDVTKENAMEVFTGGGLHDMLDRFEQEIKSIAPDVSTAKGRKEIISSAARVSKVKTSLDALGKDLVSDWKAKSKAVDNERKAMRDRLDALRDETRKPVTEWEEAEAARIEAERLAKEIEKAHEEALEMNALFDREAEIARKEAELQRVEDERLATERAEREEKERLEREEQLKREAEERARTEAEEKAKREIEEAKRKEAEAKAAQERAERERIEVQQRAEQERTEAAERAEREKQEALKAAEMERITKEEEQRRIDEALAANKEHRRKINKAAADCFIASGYSDAEAKKLVRIIASGKIAGITINY